MAITLLLLPFFYMSRDQEEGLIQSMRINPILCPALQYVLCFPLLIARILVNAVSGCFDGSMYVWMAFFFLFRLSALVEGRRWKGKGRVFLPAGGVVLREGGREGGREVDLRDGWGV